MLSHRLLLALSLGVSLVAASATSGRAETIAPNTTATLEPTLNENGWANEDVQVNLSAVDDEGGSGVASITYSSTGAQTIGSTTVNSNQASFNVTAEGTTVVHFFATDQDGNVETEETVTVRVDQTDPTITASVKPRRLWPPNQREVTVTVTGQISDALSGVDFTSGEFTLIDEYGNLNNTGPITINGDGTYSFTVDLVAFRKKRDRNGRTYTIKVSANDEAGNTATQTVEVVVPHNRRRRGR